MPVATNCCPAPPADRRQLLARRSLRPNTPPGLFATFQAARSRVVGYARLVIYAVVFLLTAAGFSTWAASSGGWGWVLLWPALAFALVGGAYLGGGPRVFGKLPRGELHPVHRVVLLPFLLFVWGTWHLLRLFERGSAHHSIAPGLLLGRRLLPGEIPPEVALVVDLSAEFDEPAEIGRGRKYVSLPVLDGSVPNADVFRRVVDEVNATRETVLVHCAQGHGRSGLLAAAVLLARGLASTPAEAVEQIQKIRPGVRLKPGQVRWLEEFAAAELARRRDT